MLWSPRKKMDKKKRANLKRILFLSKISSQIFVTIT